MVSMAGRTGLSWTRVLTGTVGQSYVVMFCSEAVGTATLAGRLQLQRQNAERASFCKVFEINNSTGCIAMGT